MARLVKESEHPCVSSIEHLAIFVEMDKKPDHVKMRKAGLELGNTELNRAETTSKTPRPAEESDLIAKTGMG